MKKQKIFKNEIFGVNRLVWEENSSETDKPLTLEELAEAAETDLTPLEIVAMQAGEAEARLQQAKETLAAVSTGSGADATSRPKQADFSKASTAADLANEQLGELTGSLAGSKEQEARFLNIPPEAPVPAAAAPVPTPEAPVPATAAAAAPAAAAAAAPAVPEVQKTEAQQKCDIMKKYVGDGADKKISFANFKELLEKYGELPADANLTGLEDLSDALAGKIVAAVTKLQEKAAPNSTNKLLRDGIFGNKTFQACVDANLINADGTLASEAAAAPAPPPEPPATPAAPAPESEKAAAPPPAPEVPSTAPKVSLEKFEDNKFLKTTYSEGIGATIINEEGLKKEGLPSGTVVYFQKEVNNVVTIIDAVGKSHDIPKDNLTQLTHDDKAAREKFKADRLTELAGDRFNHLSNIDPSKVRKLQDGQLVVIVNENPNTHVATVQKIGHPTPEANPYNADDLTQLASEEKYKIYAAIVDAYYTAEQLA